MRILVLMAGALALLAGPVAAEMAWFEATSRLQEEKNAALTCARVMKRHLPPEAEAPEAWSRAEIAYDAARTPIMAGIEGLETALADRDDTEEPALAELERRLEVGGAERKAFCAAAMALVEADGDRSGEKGVLDAVTSLADTLVEAGLTIWKALREDDELRKANLRTALEDAKWPAFSEI